MDFNTNTENKDEWLTPPEIIKALGHFDLDPCAPINPPWRMADKHYTIEDDGMARSWVGRVWLNPPYGSETFIWLKKLAEHGSGIALIFSRTETIGFHRWIWDIAHSVFFFKGRLGFYHIDGTQGGTANAPSCLVSYSLNDTLMISGSGLKGKLVSLVGDHIEIKQPDNRRSQMRLEL